MAQSSLIVLSNPRGSNSWGQTDEKAIGLERWLDLLGGKFRVLTCGGSLYWGIDNPQAGSRGACELLSPEGWVWMGPGWLTHMLAVTLAADQNTWPFHVAWASLSMAASF